MRHAIDPRQEPARGKCTPGAAPYMSTHVGPLVTVQAHRVPCCAARITVPSPSTGWMPLFTVVLALIGVAGTCERLPANWGKDRFNG